MRDFMRFIHFIDHREVNHHSFLVKHVMYQVTFILHPLFYEQNLHKYNNSPVLVNYFLGTIVG